MTRKVTIKDIEGKLINADGIVKFLNSNRYNERRWGEKIFKLITLPSLFDLEKKEGKYFEVSSSAGPGFMYKFLIDYTKLINKRDYDKIPKLVQKSIHELRKNFQEVYN